MKRAIVALSRAGGRTTSGHGGGPRSRSRNQQVEVTKLNDSADEATATSSGSIRMRRPSFAAEELPTLKEFVHKQIVIRQYRGFLRAVNMIPDATFQNSSLEEIRTSFARYKNETDKIAIQMAVTDGQRKLDQVKSMVGYVDPRSVQDEDSWLNIVDEEDSRGRVGMEWPWDQSSNKDDKRDDGDDKVKEDGGDKK